MNAPQVGVTGPTGWYHIAWRCTRYALSREGAATIRLTPEYDGNLNRIDGVVIGGGDDIDPALYAGLDDGKGSYDRQRDQFEQRVIVDCLERDRPILGICRGAQLLNVVLGGSLHQDIRDMRVKTSNRRTLLPKKQISISSTSHLYSILGVAKTAVNSLHHQAVDSLGNGLRIAATDLDGIVQAIECQDNTFRVGVQWHPEYLPYRREQRRLFNAFVAAVRSR